MYESEHDDRFSKKASVWLGVCWFVLFFMIGFAAIHACFGAVYYNNASQPRYCQELSRSIGAKDTFATKYYLQDTVFHLISDTAGIAVVKVSDYLQLAASDTDSVVIPITVKEIDVIVNNPCSVYLNSLTVTPVQTSNYWRLEGVDQTIRKVIIIAGSDSVKAEVHGLNEKEVK